MLCFQVGLCAAIASSSLAATGPLHNAMKSQAAAGGAAITAETPPASALEVKMTTADSAKAETTLATGSSKTGPIDVSNKVTPAHALTRREPRRKRNTLESSVTSPSRTLIRRVPKRSKLVAPATVTAITGATSDKKNVTAPHLIRREPKREKKDKVTSPNHALTRRELKRKRDVPEKKATDKTLIRRVPKKKQAVVQASTSAAPANALHQNVTAPSLIRRMLKRKKAVTQASTTVVAAGASEKNVSTPSLIRRMPKRKKAEKVTPPDHALTRRMPKRQRTVVVTAPTTKSLIRRVPKRKKGMTAATTVQCGRNGEGCGDALQKNVTQAHLIRRVPKSKKPEKVTHPDHALTRREPKSKRDLVEKKTTALALTIRRVPKRKRERRGFTTTVMTQATISARGAVADARSDGAVHADGIATILPEGVAVSPVLALEKSATPSLIRSAKRKRAPGH